MPHKPFDTLDDCLDFLFEATDYEKITKYKYSARTFDLNRVRALLSAAGDPDAGMSIVHVAGTKGKGSTSIMIAQLLREADLSAGLFTSPHVLRWEERIQVDGEEIPEGDICGHMSQLRPYIERERRERPRLSPTFFEIITTVALMHFRARAVDWAILEVGLGGRLDATNAVLPRVCVITPIGHDHMDKLGDTLDRIAAEKAGIIKPGVPVVSGPQEPAALAVIEATARDRDAPLRVVGKDVRADDVAVGPDGSHFCVSTRRGTYPGVRLSLVGRHQIENFATAVGALDVLRDAGLVRCPDAAVAAAASRVRCPARIEVHSGEPPVVVDGAHTIESARVLERTVRETFPGRRVVAIVGMAGDKDVAGVLREVLPWASRVLFTKVLDSARASEPDDLVAMSARIAPDVPAEAVPIAEALARAREAATREDVICVTGSMYLAGEMTKALAEDGV